MNAQYRNTEGFRTSKLWFADFQNVEHGISFCGHLIEWFAEYNHYFNPKDWVVFSTDGTSVYWKAWTNQQREIGVRILDAWKSWLDKNDPKREIYGQFLNGR